MEAKKYRYKIVSRQLVGDLITPVAAYMKVRDLGAQSVLLESSDYHESANGRSFIGINPIGKVAIEHGEFVCQYPDGEVTRQPLAQEFATNDGINQFLDAFELEGECKEYCGLFGFTSFNAVRYFENIPVKDETQEKNDAPDMLYMLFRDIVVFDHFRNKLTLIQMVAPDEKDSLDRLQAEIMQRTPVTFEFHAVDKYYSTLTDDEHRANIRKGIKHCKRGDVFQIVLSRRFVQRYEGDDFQLYRALRSINPSPYLFYFDFGGFRVFGSSPETHCRIQNRMASIDPIAGTTKRTGIKKQDDINAEYLRNDPKENAEHVMLVDLARNDLSRNCHNVKVDFYKELQYYSHVIHMVSGVTGELDEGADPIKAFIDTFPAGTLSGAPKVRAMQLISEYEPHCRGAYGGCIGFIGFNKELNQAITIRNFVSRNGELWFQAGGGIVAKSDVEYELQEVNNKLGALRKAIEEAERI